MEYYTATKKNQSCLKENQIVKSQRLGKSAMNPSSGHNRALTTEELTAAMAVHTRLTKDQVSQHFSMMGRLSEGPMPS